MCSFTDPFSGYRYYRAEQLVDAHLVVQLRDAGFPVASIAQPGSRRRSPHNAPNSYVSRTPCEDSFSPWIASAPH